MWGKNKRKTGLFNTNIPEKAPLIGVEIVGVKLTYSRCEFDSCDVSYLDDDGNCKSISRSGPMLVGDTCCWIFKEKSEFSMDGKVVFDMKCSFSGYPDVFWCGKASLELDELIDEVQDFEVVASASKIDSNKEIFTNINEVTATVSLRLHVPPLEPPIGKLQFVLWQGKAVNCKYPCYAVVGMLGPNNIARQRHRSVTRTNPANPIFDYYAELDLSSILHGDVVVELWEHHNMRNDRLLGRVVLPISWMLSQGAFDGQNMEISGWYELFPPGLLTRYNNFGQYRPYTRGVPLYTGYGLVKPSAPIGLVKIECRLVLDGAVAKLPPYPVAFALANARRIEPYVIDMSSDEDTGISALVVAASNLRRIIGAIADPPIIDAFYDIVEWRSHPMLTYLLLCLHTYTFLFAQTWQLPMIFALFLAIIGAATASRRSYLNTQIYVQNDAVVEDSDALSLSDMYKAAKTTAVYIDRMVETYAMNFERMNNVFTWADSTTTLAAMLVLFAMAATMSYSMKLLSPSLCFFLGGLSMFYPDEMHARAVAFVKQLQSRWTGEAPQAELRDVCIQKELRGHDMSGFVYCNQWDRLLAAAASSCSARNIARLEQAMAADGLPVAPRCGFYELTQGDDRNVATLLKCLGVPVEADSDDSDDEDADARTDTSLGAAEVPWTSKWCEIWLGDDPVVKVVLSADEISRFVYNDTSSRRRNRDRDQGRLGTDAVAVLIDLGDLGIILSDGCPCLVPEPSKGAKRQTLNGSDSAGSVRSTFKQAGEKIFSSSPTSDRFPPTSRNSLRSSITSESGGGSSILSEISELTVHLYQVTLEEEDAGDIVETGSASSEDGVSVAGSVRSRRCAPRSALTGANGDLFKLVFGFKSQEDQESWGKALSIATVTESERRANYNSSDGMSSAVTTRSPRQSGPMTRAFKKFMWQLLYMIPDNLELQHRYLASLARVSDDGDEAENARGGNALPTCIRIKVVSARGLPIKESRLKGINHTTDYQSTVFVQLQMKQSLTVVAKFRTVGQPKAQNPAFREEFEFNNIEFNDTTYIQIDVAVKNSSLSLGEAETKVGVITLKMNHLSQAPYTNIDGYKDWFPLSNAKTGAPIAAGDAALQMCIQAY